MQGITKQGRLGLPKRLQALSSPGIVSLSPCPLAGENLGVTFWPFNTKGVPLRTQRPLREKLQFLYFGLSGIYAERQYKLEGMPGAQSLVNKFVLRQVANPGQSTGAQHDKLFTFFAGPILPLRRSHIIYSVRFAKHTLFETNHPYYFFIKRVGAGRTK
jgi:hypothetical protein